MKLLEFLINLTKNKRDPNTPVFAATAVNPKDRLYTEIKLTDEKARAILGQLGNIVVEADSNANNPLTIRDVLQYSKISTDVNFIVEYNRSAYGIIDGCEVIGCSDKAIAKMLETLEYKCEE